MATSPRQTAFGLAAAAMIALCSPARAQQQGDRPADAGTAPRARPAPKREGNNGNRPDAGRDEGKRPPPARRPPPKRPPPKRRAQGKRAQEAEDEAIIRQLEFFLLLEMLKDYELLTEDPK